MLRRLTGRALFLLLAGTLYIPSVALADQGQQQRERSDRGDEHMREMRQELRGAARSSNIVVRDMELKRMAREDGLWKAMAETMRDDAIILTPRAISAADWLKAQGSKPGPVSSWDSEQVFMSCDSTIGISRGRWKMEDGSIGQYITLWDLQKKGQYRWVLHYGFADAPDSSLISNSHNMHVAALEDIPMVNSRVAACSPIDGEPEDLGQYLAVPPEGDENGENPLVVMAENAEIRNIAGHSADNSLQWYWRAKPGTPPGIVLAMSQSDGTTEYLLFNAQLPEIQADIIEADAPEENEQALPYEP